MSSLSTYHNMIDLFDQLGLPSQPEDIENFFHQHSLPDNKHLWEADWWNPSQANFLREELIADANWQVVMDELNLRLRKKSRL